MIDSFFTQFYLTFTDSTNTKVVMGHSKPDKKDIHSDETTLRKRAEELLKQKFSKPASQLTEAELLRLVHELEVHQIELELQNEELINAKKQVAELASEKYLKLYNGSPSGYFTISRDGDIIEANICGAKMLRKEPNQLINYRLGFFVSEDTRGIFNNFLDVVFESIAKATCEVTIIRNDLSKIYVHLDGIAVEDEEKCLISIADVTEQKVAEEKIRESEKFYQSLFNMLNGFAYCQMLFEDEKPVDFIYLLVNDAFETQTGLKDVCGKKVSEVVPGIQETSPELFEIYGRVAMTGQSESFEIYLESMKMWFSVSVYSPAREYFVAVFDVINERKNAEQVIRQSDTFLKEMQLIVRHGSFSIDLIQGKWTGSEMLDILYGIDSDYDKSFQGWISLVHPEWRQIMRDYYYYLVQKVDSHFEIDYKIIRCNDKAERWIHAKGQLNFDQDHNPVTLVGSLSDITEKKVLEEALKESELLFRNMFSGHSSIMLLIDPESGLILDANDAAVQFYGYDRSSLRSMNISQINTLVSTQIKIDYTDAVNKKRNRFIFPHKLANGMIRMVDVQSSPIYYQDHSILFSVIHDVTDRLQTEQELKESEEKWRTLFEILPVGVSILDQEGRVKEFNPALEQILGISSKGIENQNYIHRAYINSENRPMTKAEFPSTIAVKEQRTVHNVEIGVVKEDGETIWTMVSAAPLLLPDVSCAIVTRDITERKKVERKLRLSEQQYKNLFEFSGTNIIIVDREGTYLMVNQNAALCFGFTPDEIIGKTMFDLLPEELSHNYLKFNQALIDSGGSRIYQDEFILHGVKKTFLVIDQCLQDQNGSNYAIQSSSVDITDRIHAEQSLKESEEKYRNVFDTERDALFLIDKESGAILDVNESACQLYGYSCEEMLRLKSTDISPEADETRLATKEFQDRIRLRYHKKRDGTVFPVDISASQFLLKERMVILASIRDITKQIEAEEEIKLKNDELSRVNIEKDKFFSIIAHDLRSPFSGFLGLTELLVEKLDELSKEEISNIISIMRTSAINLFRLLGNLLEWSRMQRGLTTLIPILYPLKPKILESTQLVMDMADKKGITISYDIADDLVVFADGNMFDGIIRNIVSNAVKFTPKGGSIIVSATSVTDNQVEISIRDTGIGMTKEMINNLFRLDSNTGQKGTEGEYSTGLGLILCKDFIEKNHGKIWIESEVGKGSTFRVTLPTK